MSIPDKEIFEKTFKKDDIIESSPSTKILIALIAFPLVLLVNVIIVKSLLFFIDLDIVAAVFIMVFGEILIAWLAISATNQTHWWKEALYLKNFNLKNIAIGVTTGITLLMLQQIFMITALLLGAEPKSSNTSSALGEIPGALKYVMLFFVIPCVVPFIEELFYRGVIFGFIKDSGMQNKKLLLIIGAIFSSIIFSLAHEQGFDSFSSVAVLITTGGIGLANCWLIYKTDSLYTAYASHLSYNLATSGLIFLSSTH